MRRWRLTVHADVGKTVRAGAHRGAPASHDRRLMAAFYARHVLLEAELQPIEGASEPARRACAPGRAHCLRSGPTAVEMQLQKVGLAPYFGTNVFSGHEMPREPAPDITWPLPPLGVRRSPSMVEDTVTGVAAGVCGATVAGFSPSLVGHGARTLAAGAVAHCPHERAARPAAG